MTERRPGRLGVFGGTFDPIHQGHLIAAEELRFALQLDLVLFLPAAQPPHKVGRRVAPEADRLQMVEMAIAGNSHFGVSYVDISRPGLSYTAESLSIIQNEFPSQQLYFLMGQDSLRDFPAWHDPGDIARQARLGVALRPGVKLVLEDIVRRVPEAAGRIDIVDIPLIQIASHHIRQRIREGRPITYQVPTLVEEYIYQRGLYPPVPSE